MAPPVRISIHQLSRLVGTHAAPVLLGVRTEEDFNDDPRLLPAAIRIPYPDITDRLGATVEQIGARTCSGVLPKGIEDK